MKGFHVLGSRVLLWLPARSLVAQRCSAVSGRNFSFFFSGREAHCRRRLHLLWRTEALKKSFFPFLRYRTFSAVGFIRPCNVRVGSAFAGVKLLLLVEQHKIIIIFFLFSFGFLLIFCCVRPSPPFWIAGFSILPPKFGLSKKSVTAENGFTWAF